MNINAERERSENRRRLLIANPSADVYGSDLQMLESLTAMIDRGWEVIVATPVEGPLVKLIRDRGASVDFLEYPVLRRADASLSGVVRLALDGLRSIRRIRRAIRRHRPDVVYVNTVTLPWWILASRISRTPTVCHVHEAEESDPAPIRIALNAPLLAAHKLIVISTSAMRATTSLVPFLARRAQLLYNGVPDHNRNEPPHDPAERPFRLVCVGRLSPRKGTDVAVEAVAQLRARGLDVSLDLCGTVFTGYEWFEGSLRRRADLPDLRGRVTFSGYVSPVAPAFQRAHVVLAPSLREPFGNTVVEAQLAERPVVAAASMGHLETVQDNETGLLVEPGTSEAMADAVETLMGDPELAARLARNGRTRAKTVYAPQRYQAEIAELLDDVASRGRRRARG